MNEINFTFSEDEANLLLQFIDIAVKHEGLKAAEAAFILASKINKQAEDAAEAVASE